MALTGHRTFVGFGFGAIQAGLFLHEAFHSGGFRRLIVAEVLPEPLAALRRAGGTFAVNIAHPRRVERAILGPVEAEDPADPAGRARLVAGVAEASEIATAVPSVGHYQGAGPASLHRILAEGIERRAGAGAGPLLVYAAENHNRAAEILEAAVLAELPPAARERARSRTRFLNTVIGKMSGTVADPAEVRARGLAPVTAGWERAFLVEAFNRILIAAVKRDPGDPAWQGWKRGIAVFEEKPDLLPFEEAKFYGHNAVHAAAAYLGAMASLTRISELYHLPGAIPFLRGALVEESGAALLRKHGGLDPLFTPQGFAAHAEDLLARMTNPHLGDTVERVGRDVHRKLGWDDRLVGAIRLALAQGIRPRRFAVAAAAALVSLDPALADPARPAAAPLGELWSGTGDGTERGRVLEVIEEGRRALAAWARSGFSDPGPLVREGTSSGTM